MNDPTPSITAFLNNPQVQKVFAILMVNNPETVIRAWEDYRLGKEPVENPSDVKVIPAVQLEDKYWRDIYVHGMSAQDVNDELHDFRMVMDNYHTVMSHVTGDSVSKLNTDADVVCELADEHYESFHKMDLGELLETISYNWEVPLSELNELAGLPNDND